MPDLDVSFITEDPMLADTFDVRRRTDSVDQKGRTSACQDSRFTDVTGVVTQEEPADLVRGSDGQMVPRRIFVASVFAFRGAATGIQPDVIVWCGTEYTVLKVLPYSRFGVGIHEVVAQSGAATDTPQ